jgi:hypothetical protein
MKSNDNNESYLADNNPEQTLNSSKQNKNKLATTIKKSSQETTNPFLDPSITLDDTQKKMITPYKSTQQSVLDSELYLRSIEPRKKNENYKTTVPDIKTLKCNLENKIENTSNENNCFNTNYKVKPDLISSSSSQDSLEENPQSNNFIDNFGSKTKIETHLFTYQKKRYKHEVDDIETYSADKIRKYNKKEQLYSREINMESHGGIVNFRMFKDSDIGLVEFQDYEDEFSEEENELDENILLELITHIEKVQNNRL